MHVAALNAAALLAIAPFARAEAPAGPGAIQVDPGATCLDAAVLAEQVHAWLGAEPIAPDVIVDVHGAAKDARVASFRVSRGGRVLATRGFDPGPASCEQFHAVVGLAIAMALSASLTDAILGVRPVDAEPPPPEVARPWSIGGLALAAFGAVPGVAAGLDVRLERSLGPVFSLRAGAFALAGFPSTIGGLPAHYDASIFAAHADVCAGLDPSDRARIQGCAGLVGGAVVARGHSFTVPQTSTAAWVAVLDGLDMTFAIGAGWSLDVSLGIVLPLQRFTVVVRDRSGATAAAQDVPQIGDFAGLGAVRRF